MQWIRWMQVVEGATFLILSVWWAVSAALFHITVQNVKNAGMPAATGNSSVPAPDLTQNAMAASGMVIPVALGFSMLGLSVSCIWLYNHNNVLWDLIANMHLKHMQILLSPNMLN